MGEYDIAVIGGGPIGLFSTFYAGLRDMKAVVIEAQDELGGQLINGILRRWFMTLAVFQEFRHMTLL